MYNYCIRLTQYSQKGTKKPRNCIRFDNEINFEIKSVKNDQAIKLLRNKLNTNQANYLS